MSGATNIQWTDATWNPVRGCSRVSPGCEHCYAETVAGRFSGEGQAFHGYATRTSAGGRWTRVVSLVPDMLDLPLHWKKPRRVFVNSMSDLFHEDLPFEHIERVFAVMANAPQHTFQVLTKRAARMREFFEHLGRFGQNVRATSFLAGRPDSYRWPLPNVWLGVSVEDQERGDERIPVLAVTPAAVRFLSVEPMLGPVDLGTWFAANRTDSGRTVADWVIVGGESGHGARPFHLEWARSIVEQCHAAGVPVFVKQAGARPQIGFYSEDRDHFEAHGQDVTPDGWEERDGQPQPGALVTLKLAHHKGGDPAEWPEDLRVREFPR